LKEELNSVRHCGYALDRGEHIDGVMCAAAPVFDRRGQAVASLTVTAPAGRMPREKLPALDRMVRLHANRISTRLGGSEKKEAS
ncbi:MAG: IclR family transcriptional regulator, partial [Verrucomicrobiae bacterium]|nr:IclR family transcriptional regulator [Verrucomicrobiae bacterium]